MIGMTLHQLWRTDLYAVCRVIDARSHTLPKYMHFGEAVHDLPGMQQKVACKCAAAWLASRTHSFI